LITEQCFLQKILSKSTAGVPGLAGIIAIANTEP